MSIGILQRTTLPPPPSHSEIDGGSHHGSDTGGLDRARPRRPAVLRAAAGGLVASTVLLGAYLAILTLVSGWQFAIGQFGEWRSFVLALAIGFGVQIGLFIYLVSASDAAGSGRVVATTGATSTVAMVSCCTHYLVNLLPVLGATGLVGFAGQYQAELFWFGISSNLAGVAYLGSRTYSIIKGA
jgi:P-type Cu+ transporter